MEYKYLFDCDVSEDFVHGNVIGPYGITFYLTQHKLVYIQNHLVGKWERRTDNIVRVSYNKKEIM